VKVSGVVAVVVVVLIVVLLLVGGSDHGPGRHTGAGDRSSPAADHTPPAGGLAPE
jgi:preprotein translocase subunit SecG